MNISFSGGGMKGIAYIGVYKYFTENNIPIENLSGTSIGSLICLSIVLGYTTEELEILAYNFNYSLIEDVNIKNFFIDGCIDSSKKLTYMLKKLFITKGYDENETFSSLYNKTKKGLYICSTNIDTGDSIIFNHLDTPEELVYKACKYSMNIPFIWGKKEEYLDGCLSINLPIEIFSTDKTYGFTCISYNNVVLKDYVTKIVECCLRRANLFEIKFYESIGYNVISIPLESVETLDFNMSLDSKKKLIQKGYDVSFEKVKYFP